MQDWLSTRLHPVELILWPCTGAGAGRAGVLHHLVQHHGDAWAARSDQPGQQRPPAHCDWQPGGKHRRAEPSPAHAAAGGGRKVQQSGRLAPLLRTASVPLPSLTGSVTHRACQPRRAFQTLQSKYDPDKRATRHATQPKQVVEVPSRGCRPW